MSKLWLLYNWLQEVPRGRGCQMGEVMVVTKSSPFPGPCPCLLLSPTQTFPNRKAPCAAIVHELSGPRGPPELRMGASTCQTTGRGEGQPTALKRQTPGKSTSWLITTGVHGANLSSLPKCPTALCDSMRASFCSVSLGHATGSGSCPCGT